MRWFYEIVVPDYETDSETKVKEGEINARTRKEADHKVAAMCRGEEMFCTYKIPLSEEF